MATELTYLGEQIEKPHGARFAFLLNLWFVRMFLGLFVKGANTLTWISNQRAAGENIIWKIYSVVLSGSYTQGGSIGVKGEVLNFQTPLNPGYGARTKLPGVINGSNDALPTASQFEVPPVYGYEFQIEQNATAPTTANYIMRIFSTGGTELSSGAYSAVAADLVAAGAQPIIVKCRVPAKYN
jgi:hypothetical protein